MTVALGQYSAAEILEGVRRERARRALSSFRRFVALVRPEYAVQWFHELLIDELQRAGLADHDTRLGMALPPGHAKSEYALLYCAWMVARDPDIQIKYVTYSQDFAEHQFERLKEILELEVCVEHFGQRINSRRVVTDTRLGAKNSSKQFEILGGSGWVQACGFGGGITGGRCDVVVVDDPFKNHEEASSPTTRAKRWNEYGASIKTRRRVGRPLRILMLFTRWHLDDLAGRCKEIEEGEWRWVEIEALKTTRLADDAIEAADPREVGEALWPDVITASDLVKEREQRPGIFSSLYQQRPVPEGGAVFQRTWLEHTFEAHELDRPGLWVQSVDPRNDGKSKTSSLCAMGLWFFPAHRRAALLVDLKTGRWSPDETLQTFRALQDAPLWRRASLRLVEHKADGVMLMSMLRHQLPGMVPIKPTSDKVTRAQNVVPYFAAGNVCLPERAPWKAEYVLELTNFPASAHDDRVDQTTQALEYVWLKHQHDPHATRGGVVRTKHRPKASRLKRYL